MVWHSQNFFLPCVTVDENFVINTAFIFAHYFLWLAIEWFTYFYIFFCNFWALFHILLQSDNIHLISTNKRFFLSILLNFPQQKLLSHEKKTLVRHSQNFLLPCITVDESFVINTAFIFAHYFLWLAVEWFIYFYIFFL